jgi:hypothetical protein
MTNYLITSGFWNTFNWELYIKVLEAKSKQITIEKEIELINLKKKNNGNEN